MPRFEMLTFATECPDTIRGIKHKGTLADEDTKCPCDCHWGYKHCGLTNADAFTVASVVQMRCTRRVEL